MEGTKRGRRRPKLSLVVVVNIDMLIKEVIKNMILNMIEWWRGIHVNHLVC